MSIWLQVSLHGNCLKHVIWPMLMAQYWGVSWLTRGTWHHVSHGCGHCCKPLPSVWNSPQSSWTLTSDVWTHLPQQHTHIPPLQCHFPLMFSIGVPSHLSPVSQDRVVWVTFLFKFSIFLIDISWAFIRAVHAMMHNTIQQMRQHSLSAYDHPWIGLFNYEGKLKTHYMFDFH